MQPPTDLPAPHAPMCEHMAAPQGLNTRAPHFRWSLSGNFTPATARLVAGTDPAAVSAGQGDLWDSGWTLDPFRADWGGAPLPRDIRFHWAVAVRDTAGRQSPFSAPATVLTGLDPSDWQADWIARYFVQPAGRAVPQDDAYDNRFQARPADYLRRRFTLDAPPRRAMLYVTALGLYEARLNGSRVGDAVMAPGWTDYHTRVEYHAFDVTDLLDEGPNCIAAVIGEGWYSGRVGHNQRRAGNHYGGRPAFLAQLHVDTDAGPLRIVTDADWETRRGPILYSDFLAGEAWDAAFAIPGWDAPEPEHEASESGWLPVEAFTPEHGRPRLDAARCPPVREVATLDPVSVTDGPDDTRIYDFGQNLAGYVQLDASGDAGTRWDLTHAERLDDNGGLYTDNLRFAVSRDLITTDGTPLNWKPSFTFHGFQYAGLRVEGRETAPPRLRAVAIQTDLPVTGQISTGSDMVNRLLSNIFWSQRGNFLSVPTDCPQRDERYGWSADAQVFWRTSGWFMDVSSFLVKWIEDLIDGQSPEGDFPDVAPTKPLNPYRLSAQPGAPGWGDAPAILAWDHWCRYADAGLLARVRDPLARWMARIEAANPDGIRENALNNNYGDWLTTGPDTDRTLIATAYWLRLADLMARINGVLGHDTAPWTTLGHRLRASFADRFLLPDGRLGCQTQTACLLTLAFDVTPDRGAIAHQLAELVEQAGKRLQTGFLGVRHILPVLAEVGRPDLALHLLLSEDYPSWGFSIRQGATSIWERWDGWTPENGFQSAAMNSFNHYAYGAVGEFIWSRLAGIDWDETAPGFAEVRMRPIFDSRLSPVSAVHAGPRGDIASSWRVENGKAAWEVSLPPGTCANVTLPEGCSDVLLDGAATGPRFRLSPGKHRIDCALSDHVA